MQLQSTGSHLACYAYYIRHQFNDILLTIFLNTQIVPSEGTL